MSANVMTHEPQKPRDARQIRIPAEILELYEALAHENGTNATMEIRRALVSQLKADGRWRPPSSGRA